MSRRGVLKACLGAAWVGPVEGKSRVVISRDPSLRAAGATSDSRRVLNLLDRAVQAFFDSDSPVEAWKQVVRPGEVVGLKVNCLAGRGTASTSVHLVEAVCERLQQAGVSRKQIIVWDRLASDLESGGFRGERIRCIGNDEAGYEDTLSVFGSAGSLMSKTLTRTCDAVINLPVLKDHGIAGVSMALKNFFGAIHNPNKYHGNVGDPYVADVYMLSPIRQKVRITVCDAITAQYDGGPSFMPQWSWPFNGLIVARDPVALDYTGWQLIEAKRAEKRLPSLRALKREPTWIATAADARHRLGTNDPKRIERVEV
ncbi:MAG: DUF362 domain-containing protein [Bryobacteraceae bacterium]|jgi:uncharacterized protein (DUF362 family)